MFRIRRRLHEGEAIMRRHGEGGFTLMELMIVVAILGILGGVAIPAYLGYLEKARVARSIAEIRYIEKSVKLFYVTTDRYPLSLGEVSADNIRDPWGTPYQYLIVMGLASAEYPKPSVVAHTQSSSLWSWFIPSSDHATLNSSNATNHGQASKQARAGTSRQPLPTSARSAIARFASGVDTILITSAAGAYSSSLRANCTSSCSMASAGSHAAAFS